MLPTLAFDVYGTLINTQGVYQELKDLLAEQVKPFMDTWRQKQLEYSFRRALMGQYQDFATCTRDALRYTAQYYGIELPEQHMQLLMDSYKHLPAFEDVQEALKALRADNYPLYAFSNGSQAALMELLDNAQLLEYFDGVISVEATRLFKPHPRVYAHFNEQSSSRAAQSWLISGNSFDVLGALNAGMQAAWVQRDPLQQLDTWGPRPQAIIHNLTELREALENTGL